MNDFRTHYDVLSEFSKKIQGRVTTYTVPEAESGAGRIPYGFDFIDTSSADVYGWYGFLFTVSTEGEAEVKVTATLGDGVSVSSRLHLPEKGEHSFDCRLCDFDLEAARPHLWHRLRSLSVETEGEVLRCRLVRGKRIAVICDVRGRSGDVGEELTYTAKVYNCTDATVSVSAEQTYEGWESLILGIAPERVTLPPYGEGEFTLTGRIHDYMVPGTHEKDTVRFTPSGDGAAAVTLYLYSMRSLPHPMIYHTAEEWDETAAKIRKYEKFHPEFERMKGIAARWEPQPPLPLEERGYCYDTRVEEPVVFSAYMYALTKEERYAEKVARFLGYYSNTENGYPVKKKGCSQSYVQEGHFTAHIMLAFDIIYNSPSLREEVKERMRLCCRIYNEILDYNLASGHISNWVLSELTGALYCSVMLGDYERIDRFVFGKTGIIEQLRYGALDDGWWYECSISYNTWVASLMLHTAHLMRRYGIDLVNASFPIPYNKEVRASHPSRPVEIRHGMVNQKWGGIRRGSIRIKDLFDAPIRFVDYRGIMFGVNDSAEKRITGAHLFSTYDLAYRYYGDPAYLAIIKNDPVADPIFGIGELPEGEKGSEPYRESAYSDNIGLLMLRSRCRDREAKDEIQAVLRYGSHGFAHGHFDRTELLSLMRSGISVYNPEQIWWGYGHLMYKFYVQSSATKNMVTVDGKMQLPADSKRTLFSVGEGLSAGGVETTAPWGYPPFGGMKYDTGRPLPRQVEYNVADLPSLDAAPHGEITALTEPIRQARVMAVTDDYVAVFDSMEGSAHHSYDCLWQLGTVLSITSDGKLTYKEHRGQKTEDVRSDAQFITNCRVYENEGTVKATFGMKSGEGFDKRGSVFYNPENGELFTDVYTPWPKKSTVTAGFIAADMGVRIPYDMKIYSGGEERHFHHANAWILGTRKLDVKLTGDDVTLEINNLPVYNEQLYPFPSSQGLFLADAHVIYDDGERVSVTEMGMERENIDEGYGVGKDQLGGEVLITGKVYADAISVSPTDHGRLGVLRIDAKREGKRPIRFTAVVGACAFPGDKSQRRTTYGVCTEGENARFITVLEPRSGEPRVVSVTAADENTVKVTLKGGKTQVISVSGIEDGTPKVTLTEE